MQRLGLIAEGVVLPVEKGFILCDDKETGKVILISVIGSGGTSIAYKGIRKRNGNTVSCIVKEYFPEQKAKSGIYVRKKIGEKITITKQYREKELCMQMENMQRELQINQDIYYSGKSIEKTDCNNSAYVYSAEYLCRLGDSTYLALDSSNGETLRARLNQGKLSIETTLRLIYQMLIIVNHLDKKGYVHCDIKPENLWLRGEGENQSMCLLDLGSAFKLSDYQIDITHMNDWELIETADRVMDNENIGSNTCGFSSVNIGRVQSNKSIYSTTDHSINRARLLLESINAMGVGDDLFSVVKTADQLLNDTDMKKEEREATNDIWEEVKRKNSDEGFCTVEELKEEIKIIDTILHKGAHPAVLERGLKQEMETLQYGEFDSCLLCDVE